MIYNYLITTILSVRNKAIASFVFAASHFIIVASIEDMKRRFE